MGGNALSVKSIRLGKEKYSELAEVLSAKLSGYKFAIIPAYFQKADFGDMDILFSSKNFNPFEVSKVLGATEGVRNGDVTSIGVLVGGEVFQVDLITTPPESFDFALNYFSFNDQGNICGRIGHKQGFKFGHKGLIYVLRDPNKPTQVIKEITVTTSYKDALEFMGYSYPEYLEGVNGGFQTLNDLFNFIIRTPFFNKDIYLLDNRNSKARVRDIKRKSYTEFLKFSEHINEPAFDYSNKYDFRKEMLIKAFDIFPDFKHEYAVNMFKYNISLEISKKFNGAIINAITGLEGKALGEFIQSFKNSFDTKEEFEHFILDTEDLTSVFKDYLVT